MAESVDIHKLKLADLKQECAARGLEIKGNKQDLINRLEAYFAEHAEEEVNEEEALAEETEEELKTAAASPKEDVPVNNEDKETVPQKVVKISPGMSQHERLQKRAERFNVPISIESKKAARAARFGLSSVKGASTDRTSMINLTKLQERAQRFGSNASALSKKQNQVPKAYDDGEKHLFGSFCTTCQDAQVDDDEKLKKRKERFGILTNVAGAPEDSEAKKRKRAERFGIV